MTAINISTDIPSDINSLERLIAWAGLGLNRVNPTASVLEIPGTDGERVAQITLFRADDGSFRMVVRASLPLEEDYATDTTTKLWQKAKDLSQTALPDDYKSA